MKLWAAISALALVPVMPQAMSLEFPGVSTVLAEKTRSKDSTFLPIEPFSEGPVEGVTAEGTKPTILAGGRRVAVDAANVGAVARATGI